MKRNFIYNLFIPIFAIIFLSIVSGHQRPTRFRRPVQDIVRERLIIAQGGGDLDLNQ
jgi:hypothetical protein